MKRNLLYASLLVVAASCGKSTVTSNKPQEEETKKNLATGGIEVSKATTELLQASVARLVTEFELDGRSVTVFQDSYSSLYLKKQKVEDQFSSPSMILFYSPTFSAGTADIEDLGNDEVQLLIYNKRDHRALTEAVKNHLKEAFPSNAYGEAQVAMLPVKNVSTKIKAFGKEFEAEVSSDFSVISVVFAKSELPKTFQNVTDGASFLKAISGIPINYTYFVLPFNEDQCRLNIDTSDIGKMFGGNEGSPAPSDPCGNPQTLAEKAQCLSNKAVSMSLTRNEVKTLKARMDMRCTASGGGMGWKPIDELMQKMLAKGTDVIFDKSPDKWDDVMQQIAVATVGSPEKFMSTLDQVSESLNQNESIKDAFSKSNEGLEIKRFLSEYDSKRQSNFAKSSNRQMNVAGGMETEASFMDIFSGSGSANGSYSSNEGNASSGASNDEFRKRDNGESMQQYADRLNKALEKNSASSRVQQLNGKLKFIPSLRLTLKNEVVRESSVIAGLSNTQLGIIVPQEATLNVNFQGSKMASLAFSADCDGQKFMVSKPIDSAFWYRQAQDTLTAIAKDLNENPASPLSYRSCKKLHLKSYFVTNTAGRQLLPQELTLNVLAAGTGTDGQKQNFSKQLNLLGAQHVSAESTDGLAFAFPDATESVKWGLQLGLATVRY